MHYSRGTGNIQRRSTTAARLMQRPSFLDEEPPPGYIPGLGRGAKGFSTRGDKGTLSRGNTAVPSRYLPDNRRPHRDKSQRYGAQIDEEDIEADKVFSLIEAKQNVPKRFEHRSEVDEKVAAYRFNDLKRNLAAVTKEEWLNLPEASDFTRKNKRNRLQDQLNRKQYVAPDTLISGQINLTKLTEERERVLGEQLDTIFADNNDDNLQQNDRIEQYLDQIGSSSNLATVERDNDASRMRTILQSYRKAAPKKPQGWIASAILEERCGNFQIAKKLIQEGCTNCPTDEDVWLENIRLNRADTHKCKVIVATAIRYIPSSSKLWLCAVSLESEVLNKYRVVRKGLREIPRNEELWKLAVLYEKNKPERIRILQTAVSFIPGNFELWSELVNLQEFGDAKKSLDDAKKLIPDLRLWILECRLEEKFDKNVDINKLRSILNAGVKTLRTRGTTLSLKEWLKYARDCEKKEDTASKVSVTLEAIVQVMSSTVSETWNAYLEEVDILPTSLTKMLCYKSLLMKAPSKYFVWKSLRKVCEELSKIDELYAIYDEILFKANTGILQEYPQLALIYAKDVWKHDNDVGKALKITENVINTLPDFLDAYLAKIKILCQTQRFEEAETLFTSLISDEKLDSFKNPERLLYKYVSFLRFKLMNDEATKLLEDTCIKKYPLCHKFYLQLGQIYEEQKHYDRSRHAYNMGIKRLPGCALLWIALSKLDELKLKSPAKARADLDLAASKISNDDNSQILLSVARIQLEVRANNSKQALLIASQSLKKFGSSEALWVEYIRLLSDRRSSQKKTLFQDALKKTNSSYLVLLEIGLSFYRDGNYETAFKWIERAARANHSYGDSWVWLCRCSMKLNKDTKKLMEEISDFEPVYGTEWISVSKNPATQYYSTVQILETLLKL